MAGEAPIEPLWVRLKFTPEQLQLVQRWLNRNDEPWIKAAKKALDGDMSDLRERYELLRSGAILCLDKGEEAMGNLTNAIDGLRKAVDESIEGLGKEDALAVLNEGKDHIETKIETVEEEADKGEDAKSA